MCIRDRCCPCLDPEARLLEANIRGLRAKGMPVYRRGAHTAWMMRAKRDHAELMCRTRRPRSSLELPESSMRLSGAR
eukprot:7681032-Alexandrium_andersonii.AAC.1